jgi:hypothetical protein
VEVGLFGLVPNWVIAPFEMQEELVHFVRRLFALTTRAKGSLAINRSVLFWYFLISRRATVPGRNRWGFLGSAPPRGTAAEGIPGVVSGRLGMWGCQMGRIGWLSASTSAASATSDSVSESVSARTRTRTRTRTRVRGEMM